MDDTCILKLLQLLICNWSSKSPRKVLGSYSQLLAIQNNKKNNDLLAEKEVLFPYILSVNEISVTCI